MTSIWVVAIEYAGPDLAPSQPAARRPVREHAYDLDTGRLAHGGEQLRVGFPSPTRGWPSPAQLTRCAGCTHAVTALITGIVVEAAAHVAGDFTLWALRFPDAVRDDARLWAQPADPFMD